MRIALDARSYYMRTGIARHTRGLVHGLLASESPHEWLLLISDRHAPEELAVDRRRVEVRRSTAPWLGGDAERDALSAEVNRWGADLFHGVFPPHGLPDVPTLTTVFDFSPLTHPGLHQESVRAAFADAWSSAVASTRGFVAVSDATRRRLQAQVGDGRPVWTIPCGLSAPFDEPSATVASREGVLYVGTIEPRKNVALLLQAVRHLAATDRPVTLTMIGKRGWGYPDFEADLAATPGARWLGYVDDDMLLGQYRTATIAAFPSMLEGFGLPVLEAMAQGALPLISPDEALAEVVGLPQLHVPPCPHAWAEAIRRWIDDVDGRAALVSRAAARAASFSWPAAAQSYLHAYGALA